MIISPKRGATNSQNPARWFGYYAGYSPAFVNEAITYLEVQSDTIVVDPWNGSGTTTEVVHERGLIGRGFDINPAIALVAKARLLKSDVKPSHLSICDTILRDAPKLSDHQFLEDEPLQTWFSPSSAATIRGIERAIQSILIAEAPYRRLARSAPLDSVSSLAAFFYVALFRTIRRYVNPFTTSNPTWIKEPSSKSARIRPNEAAIHKIFRAKVREMFESAATQPDASQPTRTKISVADSTRLPLECDSVDAIITSPPYCTRIDYAIATWPELAVLGATRREVQTLRTSMLGSPLTKGVKPEEDPQWGVTCKSLLHAIKTHPSRASATYYYKNHVQYFDRLFRSYSELSRILRDRGKCVLVVQDSYYKDVHNDLQQITIDMLKSLRLELQFRRDHHLSATMAAVNARHRRYREDSTAIESVLAFEKTRGAERV